MIAIEEKFDEVIIKLEKMVDNLDIENFRLTLLTKKTNLIRHYVTKLKLDVVILQKNIVYMQVLYQRFEMKSTIRI